MEKITLNCASLLGFAIQCFIKYTVTNLQTLQIKELILLMEKNIRDGVSSVKGNGYVKSVEN